MAIPLEISFRGTESNESVKNLIRQQVARLERVCNYIVSCRISIERRSEQARSPYLVRIDIKIPPSHQLIIKESSTVGNKEQPLATVIRRAFDSARRKLDKLVDLQHGKVKSHILQKAVPSLEAVSNELHTPEENTE
jgi:ribosome-associated translation inhibitor RaiA